MLRRVKRKAPSPPCDVSGRISTLVSSDSGEDQQQARTSSEPSPSSVNCRRTRKVGVTSRSSFKRDSVDCAGSELQSCYNGFNGSMPAEAGVTPPGDGSGCTLSSHTPTEERPDTFPQVGTILHHLHSGGSTILPARCQSQLLERHVNSFSSEPTGQVRDAAHIRAITSENVPFVPECRTQKQNCSVCSGESALTSGCKCASTRIHQNQWSSGPSGQLLITSYWMLDARHCAALRSCATRRVSAVFEHTARCLSHISSKDKGSHS